MALAMKSQYCQVSTCLKDSKKGYELCSAHLERKRLKGDVMANVPIKKLENHGLTESPEYRSWDHAVQRTTNPQNDSYSQYGARGITICKEWLESFTQFYEDMGPRPAGTSLDRINNDGNYEPSNCRWATRLQQITNQRIRSNNTTGHKGIVALKSGKWTAQIGHKNKVYNLGTFKTIDDALKARKQAEIKYWGVTI